MQIDVHQHLWTEPLVAALSCRRELPLCAPSMASPMPRR